MRGQPASYIIFRGFTGNRFVAMGVKNLLLKLASGDRGYFLGRFASVRCLYAWWRRLGQTAGWDRAWLSPPKDSGGSLFQHLSADRVVEETRRQSFGGGFSLPREQVGELVALARTSQLKDSGSTRTFTLAERDAGQGAPTVIMATVLGAGAAAAIERICRDPKMLEIAARLLGYRPRQVDTWMFWSFVADATREQRLARNQTVDYHYDVHELNFIYLNFYLTDVDIRSGAHVLVAGTHRRKPWRLLVASVRATLDQIRQWHAGAREIVIEGPAGTGFFEDSSCYHRALPPIERERLMLQFRYH